MRESNKDESTLTLGEQVLWMFEMNRQSIWLWIMYYCKLIQTWKGKHNGSSKQETHAHEKRKVHTVTKTTHESLEKGHL